MTCRKRLYPPNWPFMGHHVRKPGGVSVRQNAGAEAQAAARTVLHQRTRVRRAQIVQPAVMSLHVAIEDIAGAPIRPADLRRIQIRAAGSHWTYWTCSTCAAMERPGSTANHAARAARRVVILRISF